MESQPTAFDTAKVLSEGERRDDGGEQAQDGVQGHPGIIDEHRHQDDEPTDGVVEEDRRPDGSQEPVGRLDDVGLVREKNIDGWGITGDELVHEAGLVGLAGWFGFPRRSGIGVGAGFRHGGKGNWNRNQLNI